MTYVDVALFIVTRKSDQTDTILIIWFLQNIHLPAMFQLLKKC